MERKQMAIALASRFLRWAGKSFEQAASAIEEVGKTELEGWLEKLAADGDDPEEEDQPVPPQDPITKEAQAMLASDSAVAKAPTEWVTGAR